MGEGGRPTGPRSGNIRLAKATILHDDRGDSTGSPCDACRNRTDAAPGRALGSAVAPHHAAIRMSPDPRRNRGMRSPRCGRTLSDTAVRARTVRRGGRRGRGVERCECPGWYGPLRHPCRTKTLHDRRGGAGGLWRWPRSADPRPQGADPIDRPGCGDRPAIVATDRASIGPAGRGSLYLASPEIASPAFLAVSPTLLAAEVTAASRRFSAPPRLNR
ncbi:hypothetical protein QE360_002247 [Sphingomonas sp. SORGH_AS789]|nr:hypothetical protein [Sphingomonas sp. SORGH_AS_0789]MDR6151047.1 hypothetical protein [Sphingomonas sp. SORGH_AS_0742]